MSKALFIVGNKRSGSSQLVRLLNLHPQVFISHESDIIWILYQFHNEKPFAPYPWDVPDGMEDTLERCGYLLNKEKSPRDNFFAVQEYLMKTGSRWLPPMTKEKLIWLGDKKPFQNTDPSLVPFILETFPEARFLHLIRHPFAVAISAKQYRKTGGELWGKITLEEIVERWGLHEKWVLDLKKESGDKVLDVRYEDLCKETEKELTRIFKFLDFGIDNALLKRASRATRYLVKNIPKIACSNQTLSIMEQYGYKPEGLKKSKLGLVAVNLYWRLRKTQG